MQITLQTDFENDALYIAFRKDALEPGAVAKTVRVSDEIFVDIGADGRLIGLDILAASVTLGDISGLSIDSLVGVKEASEIAGVNRPNFIRDYADKASFPRPVAELATGRIWLRSQVEAYAAAKTRGTKKRRERATA